MLQRANGTATNRGRLRPATTQARLLKPAPLGVAVEPRADLSGSFAEQYEIHERIGIGGMSEVYRGHDRRLDRPVAVKALHAELVGDEQSRKRFEREARLTCQVSHPFVTTVFDVVQHEGRLLLMMELIQGRTLDDILSHDRPDLPTLTRYGVEITEALSAIHQQGLIHRDLKPSNVMVTPNGHVKVMDFGLARSVPPTDELGTKETTVEFLTGKGGVPGTLPYMSPEQILGAELDQRSDLFSLGILLYESISGVHPFRRSSPMGTREAILHEEPGQGLPIDPLADSGSLREVILKLLEKERAARHSSAQELLADLRAVAEGLPRLRRTARRIAVAAVLATTATVAVGAYALLGRAPEGPRPAIAVAPFLDRTGEEGADARGAMLADLLATEMQSSSLARVSGPDVTAPLLKALPADADPDVAVRRVLAGVSADYVLLGSLYREGSNYVVTARLFPADSKASPPEMLRVSGASILGLPDKLAWSVRRALPRVSTLAAWKDDGTDVQDITTTSDEALLLYQRGLLALRDDKLGEAVKRLEGATQIDPSFALAHAKLAEARDALGYGRLARESAARARELAPRGSSRADLRMSLLLEAVWASVYSRTEEGLEATGRLASLFADEPQVLHLHATMLYRAGRYEEALAALDAALRIDALAAPIHLDRAGVLASLRRNADALAAAGEAARIYRVLGSATGQASAAVKRGGVLQQMEQYTEARAAFQQAGEVFDREGERIRRARTLLLVAEVDVLQGHAEAAGEHLDAAAAVAREEGNLGLLYAAQFRKGAQLLRQGNAVAGRPLLEEAVDLARQLENQTFLLYSEANLAQLLMFAGSTAEAIPLLDETVGLARQMGRVDVEAFTGRMLGELRYREGQLDEAISLQQRLVGLDDRRGTGRTHLHLLELFLRRGELDQALGAADRAIQIFRELDARTDLGYGLIWRAELEAVLGRIDRARADLAEAERIARDSSSGLADLASRCNLVRADLELLAGKGRRSLDEIDRALSPKAVPDPDLVASVWIRRCRAWLALDQPERAAESCRRAMDMPLVSIPQRTVAASLLAQSLQNAGRQREARKTAESALAQADLSGLYLPAARAAWVLLTLTEPLGPADADDVRRRGRTALQRFLDGAPVADREHLAASPELRKMIEHLNET